LTCGFLWKISLAVTLLTILAILVGLKHWNALNEEMDMVFISTYFHEIQIIPFLYFQADILDFLINPLYFLKN